MSTLRNENYKRTAGNSETIYSVASDLRLVLNS